MDKKIRIVFMGTPKVAADVLERMITDGFNVVALVAQPDKPVGRSRRLEDVPTKKVAKHYGIPVYQPIKIRKEYAFLEELKPDLIMTLAYGQIVPQSVLDIPKYGCLNLHGSLLPKYRGASPIQTALINNEKVTGVTLMKMVLKMDAGDMISKREIEISEDDNSTTLFDKIGLACTDIINEDLFPYLEGKIIGKPQNEDDVTFCRMFTSDDEHLNFSTDVESVYGWIRGLSDSPCAYLMLDGKKIKIFKASFNKEILSNQFGEIVKADKNGFFIQACGGCIEILLLQKEGKNVTDYKSFLNGFPKNSLLGKIVE